jgi:hypothetical protein
MSDECERRQNGKVDWKLWGPLLALAVTGLITWGMTQQSVADHARRLDRLEAMPADIAFLKAQVQFLVDAERRRQGGRGE